MKSELNRISQMALRTFPNLGEDLKHADIDQTPIEYLSRSILSSALITLLLTTAAAMVLMANEKQNPGLVLLIAGISFAVLFLLNLQRPRIIAKSRAYRIEQSLIFSLEALMIEVLNGVNFTQALDHVGERDYGQFSKEMKWINREAMKHGFKKGLEASARRNPSKIYRRVIWQIVNSLDTGASIVESLKFILSDLRKKQEIEANKYGRSMEKKLVFYIMGAIVFPSLSIILMQTASSLGFSHNLDYMLIYVMVFCFSVGVQLFFIYLIKFKIPTLLCDNVITKKKKMSVKEKIWTLLIYSGFNTNQGRVLVTIILLCIFASTIISVVLDSFLGFGFLMLFPMVSIFVFVTAYTRLVYMAETRGSNATVYLPDALRMMAANVEAGISVDHALLMSAKEEFGILGREIKIMGTDLIKNMTFKEALERLKNRIKSEPLHMSVNLISHGIMSGRNISKSLYRVASILQEREQIKQEIEMQMQSIKTTIILLVLISMPLLFSCSIVSSQVMNDFNTRIKMTLPSSIMRHSWVKPGQKLVPTEFINQYIIANIFVTGLLGSIIAGLAQSGKVKDGLRYSMALILFSELIYLIGKTVLGNYMMSVFQ
ncbi:type II secretion system F family protein [Candidatus Altiarchaeota archaeon]